MHLPLTTEQFLSLANGYDSIRSGRSFALSSQWQDLGQDQDHVWASYLIKNKAPLQLVLHWQDDLAVACSCQDRRLPCAHVIGLGLKFIDQAEMFPETICDDPWWEQHSPSRPSGDQGLSTPSAKMMEGILALERWLKDLLHQGLEVTRLKPREVFIPMADRLVDTGMLNLATEVRLLATLPNKQADWLEPMLARLGRLHLLVQGLKRFDSLTASTQADVLEAIASLAPLDNRPVRDCWQVVARSATAVSQQRKPYMWLWGEKTQRFALLCSQSASIPARESELSQPTEAQGPVLQTLGWAVGSVIEAELCFFAGSTPLRAELQRLHAVTAEPQNQPGGASLLRTSLDFGQILSLNPWFEHMPVKLAKMAVYHDETWLIQDQEGYVLPLNPRCAHGWQLQALSHDHQLSVFGLWNGEHFTPLSLWHEQSWLSLDIWRAISTIRRPLVGPSV